jgi:hypothetical protein
VDPQQQQENRQMETRHKVFRGTERLPSDVQMIESVSDKRGCQITCDKKGEPQVNLAGAPDEPVELVLGSRIGENKALDDLYKTTDPVLVQVVFYEEVIDPSTKAKKEHDVRTLKFHRARPVRRVITPSGKQAVVMASPVAFELD